MTLHKLTAEEWLLVQIKAAGLPEPVRELRFASPRRWRFDFAWPLNNLALEIQGGGFVNGRHSRGAGMRNDAEKYSEAVCLGWRILFAVPDQVESGQALKWIEAALFDPEF